MRATVLSPEAKDALRETVQHPRARLLERIHEAARSE
jgi:hypothetical protein